MGRRLRGGGWAHGHRGAVAARESAVPMDWRRRGADPMPIAPPNGTKKRGAAEAAPLLNSPEPEAQSTTTLEPTGTRLNRSMASSFSMRMQPEEIAWPSISGWLVPWMRNSVSLLPW